MRDGRTMQEAYPNETAAEEVATFTRGFVAAHKRTIPKGRMSREGRVKSSRSFRQRPMAPKQTRFR